MRSDIKIKVKGVVDICYKLLFSKFGYLLLTAKFLCVFSIVKYISLYETVSIV